MLWHQYSPNEIFESLSVDSSTGLSESEVHERLNRDGQNKLPEGKRVLWWQLFLRQFKSPLIYILIIAAVITALLQHWVDTIVISLAVFVNAGIGFYQEFHASNIFKELQRIVAVRARVLRQGKIHEIDSKNLVVGDIVLFSAGVKVPADVRLFQVHNLWVNEALLTGESGEVEKSIDPISDEKAPLGDRKNMVFMGTIIGQGEGSGIVVSTGAQTEIGKITKLTQQAGGEHTPLQDRIGRLGKVLTLFVGVSAVIIFILGTLQDRPIAETFTVAVAVAVAGIPEGLPAALSVVLAVGTQRILRKKGLVKKLVAAETLGSTNVICTDKTGTLTEGKMKLKKLVVEDARKERALLALAFANEAIIDDREGKRILRGEATDRAKLQAYLEAGGNFAESIDKFPRLGLLPFDSDRGFMASFHASEGRDDSMEVFVTGSPEVVLGRAAFVGQEQKDSIQAQYEDLADQGYRMIAMAWAALPVSKEGLEDASNDELDALVKNLEFGGLAALRDPIRKDVREAVKTTREAGVRVVMVTGDHGLTAKSIGKELGFSIAPEAAINGKELDDLSDSELAKRISGIEIFSRVNPRHKMRIINAWQARGQAVAMTGDGVNDAPALKAADIGISLGSGTDVTKEAADLVLLNNSFSTITASIRQGRIAFDNIRKVTVFLLAGSFTELILVLSSLVLRVPLPLTAVQILWTNLVEDTLPNVALAFEPGEKDVMKRSPISRKDRILDTESKTIIFIVGIFTDIMLLGLFLLLYYFSDLPIEYIRTFIFAALGLDTFFYIYSIRSLRKPIYSYNPLGNPYLVLATLVGVGVMCAAIYLPALNALLGTVPLSIQAWGVILVLGIVEIVGVEIAKLFFLRKNGSIKYKHG